MRLSPSLSAYLAFARRQHTAAPPPDMPRPKGALIWAHVADPAQGHALIELAERLAQQRPGTTMLLTGADPAVINRSRKRPVIVSAIPEDTIPAAEAFLSHWSPDICLWSGGDLQPAFLTYAHRAGIPLYLIDADETLLTRPAWRWFPDLPRALLNQFKAIFARDEPTAQYMRRLGIPAAHINVTGALRENAVTLPFNLSDREDMAALLRGRPTWLAAMLDPKECAPVLEAHKALSHLSHRALLIIVPDDPDQAQQFHAVLQQQDWRYVTWAEGALPDETTQVILAETHGEMGLWYRLSPISFMGCSLNPGSEGKTPNEPAVHGSAILYGPHVRAHLSGYSRYTQADAARMVRDADTLAGAVQRLFPPDQSAMMAHAAWDVASEGAALTDRVLSLIQDELDTPDQKEQA